MKKHYVYALYSESCKKIYVGFSLDPDKRLEAHNAGKAVWSGSCRHLKRFHTGGFNSKQQALSREKYLKSGWGRKELNQILERWQVVNSIRKAYFVTTHGVASLVSRLATSRDRMRWSF